MYDAWHSPEVLAIISKVAGVELVPQMDFEIAHINVSLQSEADKEEAAVALAEKASRDADEGVSGCPWEEDKPIVDWHTDSYPFVCVLMLSDCTNMIGGETALRTGSGDIMRIRGPQMVSDTSQTRTLVADLALRALHVSCKGDTSNTRLFVHWAARSVLPWSPHFGRSLPWSRMTRF